MHRCVICKREKRTTGFSFHKFPKDLKQLHLWLINIGKENYTPKPNSVVCSEHFAPECLEQKFNLVRLKKGSVPTICIEKNHAPVVHRPLSGENMIIEGELKPTLTAEASIESHGSYTEGSEIHALERNATSGKQTTPRTQSRKLVENDHPYTYTPGSYRIKLNSMYKNLHVARNSNRVLKQKVKRLQTTVSSLKELVRRLKDHMKNGRSMTSGT